MSNLDKNNDEQKNSSQNLSGNPILWIIVALYLIYTSWTLAKGVIDEGLSSKNWYFLLFAILFVGFAIWLIIRSASRLKAAKEKKDREMEELIREEKENEYRRAHGLPTLDEERIFREMDERDRAAAEAAAEEPDDKHPDGDDE